MKKILILLTAIGLLLLNSCDRRKSKIDRIGEAVKVFNKNNTLNGLISYYPKNYTETKTDSIISETFYVSVKNHSLMTDYVATKEPVKHKSKITTVHRVFVSDITVRVNDQIIYNKHISAEKFKDSKSSEFWDDATLEQVWVNQEQSHAEKLYLQFSIINPKSKAFKLYEICIDTYGNEEIIELKDYS